MRIAGIVCEYNPFHNGHKYHIEETRKQLNTDGVVCVMSGDVVQRGGTAVFPMKNRAETAVRNGADLVLEIPPRFVLQSAQFYAHNAVYILDSLGVVDYLSFGSESGDINELEKAVSDFDEKTFRKSLESGKGYAEAMGTNEILKSPNNILGAEYLKALKSLDSKIIPFTVSRKAVMHDSMTSESEFASATYIRQMIKNNEDFSEFVPENEVFPKATIKTEEELWELISYRLKLGCENNFENIMNMSEGLNNRIIKLADCSSFSECVEKASCKRYPKSRIRRALFSILFNFEKNPSLPTYTRVLALNENGRKILSASKKTVQLPVLSRVTKKDIYNIPFLKQELTTEKILYKQI